MTRNIVTWRIRSPKITERLRLAVAPDMHSGPFEDVLPVFREADAVLLAGDLLDRHRKDNHLAAEFLRRVPEEVPVFYSIGNHECKFPRQEEFQEMLRGTKAQVLDNRDVLFRGIRIAGLSSSMSRVPDMEFLERLEARPEFILLMCHHPEMYRDYVRGRDIDFTVCGHAHGGQIQILGRGLYAPGQGLFPKLTHGLYDKGKMLVSRGMTNSVRIRVPRIGNPCELILLELEPGEGGEKQWIRKI